MKKILLSFAFLSVTACYGAEETLWNKEKFLGVLGKSNYMQVFRELDGEQQLAFSRSFKECFDDLEGVAVKKNKLMDACRSVLEKAKDAERTMASRNAASLTSDEEEIRRQRFLEAKKGFCGTSKAASPTVSVVALPEGALTMAERLDRMRTALAGEREEVVRRASSTAARTDSGFDVEHTSRVIAEIAEIEMQLTDATERFQLAQTTKAQADVRAREEAAALDFATNRLPTYLNRILGDDAATAATMLEMFNEDYTVLKASEEMSYLLRRNGVTDETSIAEIEGKIEILIASESINDAFSLIKYVEEKRAVSARSAADLLAESQRQEADASALLDGLTGRFRVLQGR